MTFDEMLEAWRTQDETPPYRVNPDLFLVVVQQEQASLRREMGLGNSWAVPWALWAAAGAMLVVAVAALFAVTRGWATAITWDYLAMGVAISAMLLWPVAYSASRRRQSPRERAFGNSLQEEIRRNLSWVDNELSRHSRLAPSLLRFAPMGVAAILYSWVIVRTDNGPVGWAIFFSAACGMLFPLLWTGHYFKTQLLEYRRRLSQLLELLNANE